jgi:HD superfamily phosphohydrolase
MKPKLFRDPVHDIVAFDTNDPVEHVLFEIICSGTFQRLRRIRQLGFAHLVYHGAEHSRFQHSVGVLHVARRIIARLELDEADRLEALCAAALHDIGHGPFSHAIEKVTGMHHEEYTLALLLDPDGDIFPILQAAAPDLPDRVAAYFRPRSVFPPERGVLRDVVSSQLDADRLDYILRDGLATGVKIGVYDFERILTMFVPAHVDGTTRLGVSYRAREAVEGYLIARFHMFKQVYLHKTVRSAEKMLEAVLRRAGELLAAGALDQPIDPALKGLLEGRTLAPAEYARLDDTDIWVALKLWRASADDVLSNLSAGLLDRDLYKTFTLDASDPVAVARLHDRAREIAREHGYDPEYAVLIDRAQDTPYRPYAADDGRSGSHIPIVMADGTAVPIEEVSDLVHLLGRDAYKITRLCVPAALRDPLQEVVSIIGGTL